MHTGIDLGLKTTALVTIGNDGKWIYRYTFGSDVNKYLKQAVRSHPAERWQLYQRNFNNYFEENRIVGTVVMEQPLGKMAGHATKLLEIKGIYLYTLSLHFPFHKIFLPTPTAIKKTFTNDGTASKDMMVDMAKEKGYDTDNHHIADAIAMALMSYEGNL